jgi:hypothetical protein
MCRCRWVPFVQKPEVTLRSTATSGCWRPTSAPIQALLHVEGSAPPVHDIEMLGAPNCFSHGAVSRPWGLTAIPITYEQGGVGEGRGTGVAVARSTSIRPGRVGAGSSTSGPAHDLWICLMIAVNSAFGAESVSRRRSQHAGAPGQFAMGDQMARFSVIRIPSTSKTPKTAR